MPKKKKTFGTLKAKWLRCIPNEVPEQITSNKNPDSLQFFV